MDSPLSELDFLTDADSSPCGEDTASPCATCPKCALCLEQRASHPERPSATAPAGVGTAPSVCLLEQSGTVTLSPCAGPLAAVPAPPMPLVVPEQISRLQRHTADELAEGRRRLDLVLAARPLRAAGLSWQRVADRLGVDQASLWRWEKRVAANPAPTAADLADKLPVRENPHALAQADALAIREALAICNRTYDTGSIPEAVRHSLAQGRLSAATAARVRARLAAGQPPLTPSQARQVMVPSAAVRALRGPREAWLDHVYAPGSLQITTDPGGEERHYQPGEAWTIDDGTINFVACVPFDLPGNVCAEKFGVMLGRFQFLLIVDHASRFIPGFCYTARPRSSYRAEDIMATYEIAMRQHGVPRQVIMEKGVSAANNITTAMRLLGVEIVRANSPHQKVVENVFNVLWTKLSFHPGQVGRDRGDEEKVNALVESCRAGHTDPRRHFMMLADVVTSLREVIYQFNAQPCSGRYGRWIPEERWQARAAEHLRPLPAEDVWMLSPHITDPLKVRSACIATSVSLMEGHSQVFTFSAAVLSQYIGARVRLHFNPFAPDSTATAVLAEPFAGLRAGSVLGALEMVDRDARLFRRRLGYSDERDTGRSAARAASQSLRRLAVAVAPGGKPALAQADARDGEGRAETVTNAQARSDESAPRREPLRNPIASDLQSTRREATARVTAALAELE